MAINQKINSNWRIHQDNIDSFKEQIESALCDMIDILEIEQKYEIKKRTDYISPEELTIQISANKLTINIHNLENFYTVVQKALNSTEIPEREKEELNLIIEEGLANPKDTGILKKVCTRLHAGFEKYSGELSAIGTVLSVFAPIIGV